MPPRGPHLSRHQFEAQVADRWAALGVEYHAMNDGHDWGHPAFYGEPEKVITIDRRRKLVTDQSSAEFDQPKSKTPGEPIQVHELPDGRLRVWDGHHRLIKARKAGVSIKAEVWPTTRPKR